MPLKLVKDRRPGVVAAIETPPRAEGAPTTPIPGRRFHAVLAVEGVWTGDGRYFEPGCFTWRDLPLPLMATDKSPHGPGPVEPSIIIGSIDRKKLREVLELPNIYEILLVVALGAPGETIQLETAANGDIKYWRDDKGVHHVPKRALKDIVIN